MTKNHIVLILLLGIASLLISQVSNYTFSEGTGAYTPLASYSVSTAAGDNAGQLLSIPFTFTYSDIEYNDLYVCTNGFVKMGTSSSTSSNNTLSATASTRLNIIAPLWDDLFDDESSEIRYTTLGSEPNRIFVIEWYGVLWNTSMGTPQHFQLHLSETTNQIMFSYNLQEPGGYSSATIGINAAPGGMGNYLSITPGNPSSVSSSTSNNMINDVSNLPTGKWFVFAPPDPNAPPAPAILVSPTIDSVDNLEYSTLRWLPGSGNTAGYKLYFGLTDSPEYIGDLGNVTNYNHSTLLSFNTTYYWKVVPYNAINLDAENCPVWNFTIRPNAVIDTFPTTWDFGTSFGNSFPPPNWSRHNGILGNPTQLGNSGTGSWGNFFWCNDSDSENVSAGMVFYGYENGWLILPPVQVPDNDYELTFDLANMSWYSQSMPPDTGGVDDIFAVLVGDGISWTPANILRQWDNQGSAYVLNDVSPTGTYVSLPLGPAGTKYVAFYGISTEWNVNNDLMIDNVSIREIPSSPIFSYSPAALVFGEVGLNQQSDWQNVTITNTGGGTLNLTEDALSIFGLDFDMFEVDASNLPAALPGSHSVEIPVRFLPLSEGPKEATLRISYGDARVDYYVALSGIGSSGGEVIIGEDDYNLNLPIYPNFSYSYSQTIYDQSLIERDGLITKISYYYSGEGQASASNEWVVYMAHSDNNEFENDMDWMPLYKLTKVFEGDLDLPNEEGWVEIELNTPFYYNNTEHLLIAVDENQPDNDTSNCFFYSSPADSNVSMLRYDPIFNPDPYAPVYSNYLLDGFPNIKLLFEASTEDLIPPMITHLPLINSPRTDISFLVTAEIIDDAYWNNDIDGANLFYSINGGDYVQAEMVMDREAWAADIPAQDLDTEILYYIEAWDSSDNYTVTDEYRFNVQDPVWISYNNDVTSFSNVPYSVWGAMNLFENPYYENGVPLKLLEVSGRMMDGALANLHVYTWDGIGDPMVDLVDVYDTQVMFGFDEYQSFDLSAEEIVINTPYFMISFEDLPENSWFAFDENRPYDVSYFMVDSTINMHYKPGVWMIEAYVTIPANLEAPELTISNSAGAIVLDWNEVDGAQSYLVFSSTNPFDEDSWELEIITDALSYSIGTDDGARFFKVIASQEIVDRSR